ncbi:MCE family protein [Mycobacterium paraintracellulare]|uniref:MCE family protein n=1 Tax=Mycobacterium paraintracellulare TaxID=1138383 RepID=UPI001928202A|nr:MCE family protein [Mycobacterium paraintracellulare]BCP14266.1 hypothetical protein MINTM021_11750 [Mycobacterium paraintracellulare]
MSRGAVARRLLVVVVVAVLTASGCAFRGLNSLPLPGVVGRVAGAVIYHVELANVATLESNSPVMIHDVVVGSVGKMTVEGWHAAVDISVKPEVVVPANAVAAVGQTSLLGSLHLELNPPQGQPPTGRLRPGDTIPLDHSSTYPSTEQTLSALSAVVSGGGLGQIGEIIHNSNAALAGHEDEIRDLLTRLDNFVGTLDDQRADIVASIDELNRLSGTFADQRDVITTALQKIPPALDVLVRERPRFTAALDKLHTFSDVATRLVNDAESDLVANLQNLEPTLEALARVGSDLGAAVAYAPHYPFNQDVIDRGVKGDYLNLFAVLDLTLPRLKRTLLLGTRWGQPGAALPPAPGDPLYLNYTYDPLGASAGLPIPTAPPAPDAPPPASQGTPPPPPQPQPTAAETFPPMDQAGS